MGNHAFTVDKGILWLTNYSNKYTANAVSVTATDDDRVIVMWEKATVGGGFLNSYYVILSANGRILQNVTGLGGRRLNIYEAPVYRKGYLYWTSAEGGTQKVKTYCMKVNGVSVPKSIEKVEGLTYEKEWEKWPDPIVVLKWERADDAEGYEVYRSVSRNKNYKKVKEIKSAGVLSWSDKKALKGTTYYYKVRAFRNINGEKLTGKYSQPLKVTVDWP